MLKGGYICKPSLDMSHEPSLSPKDFQSLTNNQVVHVGNHPEWPDEIIHIGTEVHNCQTACNFTKFSNNFHVNISIKKWLIDQADPSW